MTTPTPTMAAGIGARLRVERERRRISLQTVSAGTLVRLDYLYLIDEDRFEDLPPGAYAKGFIRSYASFLGLAPDPFVAEYEQRYEQPAPELARVVHRGIRVPVSAHARTWKIAAAAAVVMLGLLALLGVFRADPAPEPVPDLAAQTAISVPTAAPNPLGAVVQIEIVGEASWVEATVDGQDIFAATLERGETRTFKGVDRVTVFLARAREVRIIANGVDVGVPSEDSYRGEFTPATDVLPPHTPAEAPAAEDAAADTATQ